MQYDKASQRYVFLQNDALIFTIKDIDTLETELKIIPHPTIDFYVTKMPQEFHKAHMPIEECRKITTPLLDKDRRIAETLGILPQFLNAKRGNNMYEYNKAVKRNPNLYGIDIDIQDFYKTKYYIANQDEAGEQSVASSYKICYSDTEVDISTFNDGFPDPHIAPCPINLITNIFEFTKEAISYILYDERVGNDIKDIVSDPNRFIKEYLDPMIVESGLSFKFKVFEKEEDLIIAYFNDIKERKPDFCMWWNMNFDGNTILNRLKKLGYTDEQIADIMCSEEVPKMYRHVRYIDDPQRSMFETSSSDDDDEDEADKTKKSASAGKNKPHPSRLFDWWEIAGYTQMVDQMALYSCMRKRSLLPSYKLDDIGLKEANIGKYNLKENGYDIKDVNVKNFKIFLAYNIRDSFVQYKIENACHDVESMIIFAGNTKLSKSQSMSNCVKNEIYLYLFREGNIMGNCITYDISEKIKGALVCRPELIQQYGIKIFGCKNSFVFEDAIDSDASSLYPSMIIIHNISKEALFGRIVDIVRGQTSIGNGVEIFQNNPDFENTIMTDIQTIDMSIFDMCKQYMDLPDVSDIIKIIDSKAINAIRVA